MEVSGGAGALSASVLQVKHPFMGEEFEAEGGNEEGGIGKAVEVSEAGEGEGEGSLGRLARKLGFEEILGDLAGGAELVIVCF